MVTVFSSYILCFEHCETIFYPEDICHWRGQLVWNSGLAFLVTPSFLVGIVNPICTLTSIHLYLWMYVLVVCWVRFRLLPLTIDKIYVIGIPFSIYYLLDTCVCVLWVSVCIGKIGIKGEHGHSFFFAYFMLWTLIVYSTQRTYVTDEDSWSETLV